MKLTGALLVAAGLLVSVDAGFYPKGGHVKEVGVKDFKDTVLFSPLRWVVEFYAPWCGHCKNLAPIYKALATSLEDVVSFAAVDCDQDANKPMCGQYGVQGFPTIKIFEADATGNAKKPKDYNGERDFKKMSAACTDDLPTKYVKRLGEKTSDAKMAMSDFLAQKNETLPKLLIFRDKPDITVISKALSLRLKGKVAFGQVYKSETGLVKQFGVTSFTTILLLVPGEPAHVYDGPPKAPKLLEFIKDKAKLTLDDENKTKAGKEKEKKQQEEVKQAPFNATINEVKYMEDFDAECVKPSAGVLSPLCVLVFMPLLEPDFPESVQQHSNYLAEIVALKRHYYDAAAKSNAVPAYFFMWLDGSTEKATSMINKFGLSSDLPGVLFISPTKHAYSPFKGSFKAKSLQDALDALGRGKSRAFSYEDSHITLPSAAEKPKKDGKKAKKGTVEHDEL